MQVNKIVQQTIAKKHTEEKTHYRWWAIQGCILHYYCYDDGNPDQETISRYSIEIEKRLAAHKKMVILDKVLTVSSWVAIGYSSQVEISIDIGSYQLEEISITTTATLIARGT